VIHASDVREWRNCDVVDSEDHKIGVLEAAHARTVHGHDDCFLRNAL
jgi:hypothetical protein